MIIKASEVRKIAREHKKRVSPEFIEELNRRVHNKIVQACQVHNGGKKTLDTFMAGYVFGEGR